MPRRISLNIALRNTPIRRLNHLIMVLTVRLSQRGDHQPVCVIRCVFVRWPTHDGPPAFINTICRLNSFPSKSHSPMPYAFIGNTAFHYLFLF